MPICSSDPKKWRMCLVRYDAPCSPGDPDQEEFCFSDVIVTNEILTGKVTDRNNNMADLMGTCSPFDDRSNVSRMSFFFLAANNKGVPLEILLTGWGYQALEANPIFVGGFLVLKPLSTNLAALPAVVVSFDEGDTGTGTGMQAECGFPVRS